MVYKHSSSGPRETATATVTSHAGEILQGAVRNGARTRRLLLSLPAPTLWTRADVFATPGKPLSIEPSWTCKARSAAQLLFRSLHLPEPEATVRLTTNIPVGKGCGSSSADILATVRALLAFTGLTMDDEPIARFIVDVEEATDGSVLSRPALFRHREGLVEEYLPGPFPAMSVVVIDAQPAKTINTVSMTRARYSEDQLATFDMLVAKLRRAFHEGNPGDLGAVATTSARISQQFLPKPHFEALTGLVLHEGGYGLSVSHSGTIVCGLFPIDSNSTLRGRIARRVERLGMHVVTDYELGGRAEMVNAA